MFNRLSLAFITIDRKFAIGNTVCCGPGAEYKKETPRYPSFHLYHADNGRAQLISEGDPRQYDAKSSL